MQESLLVLFHLHNLTPKHSCVLSSSWDAVHDPYHHTGSHRPPPEALGPPSPSQPPPPPPHQVVSVSLGLLINMTSHSPPNAAALRQADLLRPHASPSAHTAAADALNPRQQSCPTPAGTQSEPLGPGNSQSVLHGPVDGQGQGHARSVCRMLPLLCAVLNAVLEGPGGGADRKRKSKAARGGQKKEGEGGAGGGEGAGAPEDWEALLTDQESSSDEEDEGEEEAAAAKGAAGGGEGLLGAGGIGKGGRGGAAAGRRVSEAGEEVTEAELAEGQRGGQASIVQVGWWAREREVGWWVQMEWRLQVGWCEKECMAVLCRQCALAE